MHAGKLETPPRLRATLAAIADGRWHSTREIMLATGSCAVHSDMAGLKANGIQYETESSRETDGRRRFAYRLVPTGTAQGELGI